jgi:hypothetical protein
VPPKLPTTWASFSRTASDYAGPDARNATQFDPLFGDGQRKIEFPSIVIAIELKRRSVQSHAEFCLLFLDKSGSVARKYYFFQLLVRDKSSHEGNAH